MNRNFLPQNTWMSSLPNKILTNSKDILSIYILSGCVIMSHGAFAASKIRANNEKLKSQRFEERSQCKADPTHYSSKFMNSIWGMYNRYSVHNFKKNMDPDVVFVRSQQMKDSVGQSGSVERSTTDHKGSRVVTPPTFLSATGLL